MAVRRKIEDESDAVRCLRAAERWGRGARDWARAHGVDGRSLHAWQMNLARSGTSTVKRRKRVPRSTAHALVELVPAAAPVAGGPGRYALVVGDARVEFGDDVSVTTLRRVLEALRSC